MFVFDMVMINARRPEAWPELRIKESSDEFALNEVNEKQSRSPLLRLFLITRVLDGHVEVLVLGTQYRVRGVGSAIIESAELYRQCDSFLLRIEVAVNVCGDRMVISSTDTLPAV
jgi:hypothetical protein